MSSTKVVPVEATRHMIDAMIDVADKDGAYSEMFEAAVRAAPELYTRPVYMYSRLGMAGWVVCDKSQYDQFKDNRLFRTRMLQGMAKPLKVWEGEMPETNGKTNYTAILYTDDIMSGITIDRSEYPDRVRYEADRFRYMIGQLDVEPCISDYDANKHSGFKGPKQWFTAEDIQAAFCAGINGPTNNQTCSEYLKSVQE